MTESIDLTAAQRNTLLALLQRYLPGVAIWAYGSRVKWTARPNSDLDLVAFTTPAQRPQVGDLKDALAESNLPFPVDLHVWDDVPERFREIIRKEYVVVQEAKPPQKKGVAGEWRESTVADIAAPVRNALVGGPFGSNLVSRDYVDTGVPVIRGQNMGGRWVSGEFAFVTTDKAEALEANLAHADDIIFTQRGTLGQVSVIPAQPYEHYLISQSQMKLTVNRDIADPLFYYYVFSSVEQQDYIRQHAIQTGVPHTNLGILRQTPVPLPPLYEQRAIAHILGTLDDKIELNRRMNETLEAMARALFKSWFIDFDPVRRNAARARNQPSPGPSSHPLPLGEGCGEGVIESMAFDHLFPSRLVDSELGEIPAGWEVATLGDVAEHPRRGIEPEEIKPDTPYIALEHMPKRSIALSEWGVADRLESNKFEFRCGEILFGKLRPYFHKVGMAPIDGVCSTDIVVVAPKVESWFGFVLGHVSSDAFVEHTNASSTGTRMPRTSWADMARYTVAIPPESIALAFSARIRPSIERVIQSIRESRTLAALRDALLPKLISGELRVTDAKRFVERGCEPTARNHDPYRVRW